MRSYLHLINPIRDRPYDSKIDMYDENGKKISARTGFKDYHPLVIGENGKETIIYARDKKECDNLASKKKKELDRKGIKYTFSYEKPPTTRHTVYPSPNKYHSFLRVPILKGLAKIIVNYHLHTGGDRTELSTMVNAINTKEDTFSHYIGRPYNPIIPLFKYQDTEICHTIYIRGDASEGVLFAYIELIDFISAMFIIDINYSGSNFEKGYCFDLIKGIELQKQITYDRDRFFF